MKIKFLGHSIFYIESSDYKAIIDPFITGNPGCTASLDDFDSLTHIFVTHAHGDHLGDTIKLAKQTGATIITNFELANYLLFKNDGINVHSMHIGGRAVIDGVSVKMTPALHGSGIITQEGQIYCGGNPCGFVIEYDGRKIYHAGDTGLTMDMQLLEIEEVDVAMLPIGGNFTMDVVDAIRALDFIKPKLAIPMHYNTFPPIKADPHEFKDGASCDVNIMEINSVIEI